MISFLKFAVIWLCFNFVTGSFDHLNEPPCGVHQGAQCDRASLALNYYQNGMQFFLPEVHENRCKDGIVSCELPLSNYLSAILYKLFGFNEIWFRLLTFTFISAGFYAMWLLFKLYVKTIVAYILVFLIYSSSIVLFYATNFIPDATALGLVLLSWYLFFRLFIPHPYYPNTGKRIYQALFIISLSLAIAGKTTCIIQWMTMSGVLFLSYFRGLKINIFNRKSLLYSLITALILPLIWQLWARQLGKLHNNEYFLLHIPVPNSFADFRDAWHIYLSNWPEETFKFPLYILVFILLIVPIFLKRYITNSLWYLMVINLAGSAIFLGIMIKQFMYHDYYVLCLLPCFVLNWIVWSIIISKLGVDFWRIKIAVFVGICAAFLWQYNFGKSHLAMRYTEGNYWEQSQQNTTDYRQFKTRINQLGVDKNQCVLVGFDGAPNNILYLLNLKGRRINKDFTTEQISESIEQIKPVYIISNDSVFYNRINPYFKELTLMLQDGYLNLYKVENN